MQLEKVLFIGMPGSGKGTQAKLLAKYGFAHISTGDIIRKAFQEKDKLIMSYKEHINEGGFLPDELILKLIEQSIVNLPKSSIGYVLDGAVRTIKQAEFAVSKGLISNTVYFTLPEKQAIERLTKRHGLELRIDDSPKAIRNRFKVYKKQTAPILVYLKKHTNFIEIDASPSIEQIHKQVVKKLGL